jgi:hypothetical protein
MVLVPAQNVSLLRKVSDLKLAYAPYLFAFAGFVGTWGGILGKESNWG